MRAEEFITEAIDPNLKFELNKILSQNWKGAAAEKLVLGHLMRSPMYDANAEPDEWIDNATEWLQSTKQDLKKKYPELDLTDLDQLAFNLYTMFIASKGKLEEAYQGGLRKWFKEKWVNLAKKKKGGRGYEPCGTSGDKSGYAKCVPSKKASQMSDKEEKSAISRKRAAQRKAGRPGKQSGTKGKAPILVKTKVKEDYKSDFDQMINKMIKDIWDTEAQRKVAKVPRYLVYSQNSGLEMDTDNLEDAIFSAGVIAKRNLDSPSLVFDRKTKFPVVAYNGSEDMWYKTNPNSPKLHEDVAALDKVRTAIVDRVKRNKLDLVKRHGIRSVVAGINDIAQLHSNTPEKTLSDVHIWVKELENMLDRGKYNQLEGYSAGAAGGAGIDEDWSKKYKKSINCNNPKGFSQKAHCAGRKARQAGKHTKSSSLNEYGEVERQRKIIFTKENPPSLDYLYQQFIQRMLNPENNIDPYEWIAKVNDHYGLNFQWKDYQKRGQSDYTNNWQKVINRYIVNKK